MNERLTLQDLVDLLSEKQGSTKKDAESFLRELFAVLTESIESNESVRIKDFGIFKLVKVNARKSVDVNTGDPIEIPSHYKLSFVPDKSLKEAINRPFAHFESVILEDGVVFEKELETEKELNNVDEDDSNSDEENELITLTKDDNDQTSKILSPNTNHNKEIIDSEKQLRTNKIFETDDTDKETIESDEQNDITSQIFVQAENELDQNSTTISSTQPISLVDDGNGEKIVVMLDDETRTHIEDPSDNSSQKRLEEEQQQGEEILAEKKTTDIENNGSETSLKEILMNSNDDDDDEYELEESPEKGFNKKWTIIVIVIVAILAFVAGYFYYCCSNNGHSFVEEKELTPSNQEALSQDSISKNDTLGSSNHSEVLDSSRVNTYQVTPSDSINNNQKPKLTKIKRTKVKSGQTLRMMGLEYYGNKSFWVYIYQENKSKITNPNNVPIGTELIIPSADKYDIDAKNSESLRKAKDIERQIFKQLK